MEIFQIKHLQSKKQKALKQLLNEGKKVSEISQEVRKPKQVIQNYKCREYQKQKEIENDNLFAFENIKFLMNSNPISKGFYSIQSDLFVN
jgi:hypothetical protein